MLSRISVEKYRAFDSFKMDHLARVNLLVGKNNAGKSSLLEAVQLISSPTVPVTLASIASQRGQVVDGTSSPSIASPSRFEVDLTSLFCGHDFNEGAAFEITGDNARLSGKVIPESQLASHLQNQGESLGLRLQLKLFIHGEQLEFGFSISFDGSVDLSRFRSYPFEPAMVDPFILSVSPQSLTPDVMRSLWDQVIEQGQEDLVIRTLRIIDPRISSVAFLAADRSYRHSRTGVLLGFEGQKRRFPLGNEGEGTRRMLALALALARTADGTLLIDEIDTGLHWSVMADMWRLVIETAQVNNTQVFATTHSADCVRGLSDACRLHPELSELISVQTIDRELDHSIPTTAEELYISIEQEIEVRG